MRKRLIESIALLLALAVLLGALAWLTAVVTPKQHDYGSVWGHFLREQKDSVDVMFFGSSIVYCDVVPAVYWRDSGLTAFVHAGPEQTLPVTLEYVRESLKTQSPAAIFVDCSGLAFPKYTRHTKTNIGQMPWGLPRLRATFTSAEPELIGGLLFPLIFYHDRWSYLTEDDFRPYDADILAGYTWLDRYVAGPEDLECEERVVTPELWERNAAALEKLYALCRREGIELVLFRAPVASLSEDDWQRLCAAYEGLEGVRLLDCLAHVSEIGAEIPTDFYDELHYNGAGAAKFSAFLANWTRENLPITPRPQDEDNKTLWQSRLTHFTELLQTPMNPKEE